MRASAIVTSVLTNVLLTYIPQLDAAHFDRLNAALRPHRALDTNTFGRRPVYHEGSENLLSALACFDRLNTPLQAAWTYRSADMSCAAFTPVSKHIFASTPTAEFMLTSSFTILPSAVQHYNL